MPLRAFIELQGLNLNNSVALRTVRYMDTFIDSKARDLAKLMIGMSSDRANAIRRERPERRFFFLCIFNIFVCCHGVVFP